MTQFRSPPQTQPTVSHGSRFFLLKLKKIVAVENAFEIQLNLFEITPFYSGGGKGDLQVAGAY